MVNSPIELAHEGNRQQLGNVTKIKVKAMGRIMDASHHWKMNGQQSTSFLNIPGSVKDDQITKATSDDDDVSPEQVREIIGILSLSTGHSVRAIDNLQLHGVIAACLTKDVDHWHLVDGGSITNQTKTKVRSVLLQPIAGFIELSAEQVVENISAQFVAVTPSPLPWIDPRNVLHR